MIKVKLMKFMAVFTMLASLFGCGKGDPHILDGPGMVYVDSDYRTEYANCLPFDTLEGLPNIAVAYLGNGAEGEANLKIYTEKIFKNLDEDKISNIKTYQYEGNDWFLVIPRYISKTDLKKGDEIITCAAQTGEAFAVRCNQDITVNIFETVDINYNLSYDENGKLKNTNEHIWDITEIDEILNN